MSIENTLERIATALEAIAANTETKQTTPEVAEPEVATPKRTRRTKSEIAADNEVAEPEVAEPEVAEPEVAEPEAESGITQTDIVAACKILVSADPTALRGILDHFKAPTLKDVLAKDYRAMLEMVNMAVKG